MTEPLAVDVEEAAALVGISKRHAEALIARHEMPHVRLGDRVVVPVAALECWLVERALQSLGDGDDRHLVPAVVRGGDGGRRRPRAG